jgi:hypothetical protein
MQRLSVDGSSHGFLFIRLLGPLPEGLMTNRPALFLLLAPLLLSIFTGDYPAYAIDPRFELDPRMLQQKLPPKPPPVSQAKESAAARPAQGETSYRVKRGDSLTKILMRDYGMSKDRAKALIPEIRRRNRLGETGGLKAGINIILPLQDKGAKSVSRSARRVKKVARKPAGGEIVAHRLSLYKGAGETGNGGIVSARLIWEKLLPGRQPSKEAVSIKGNSYSLELDPERFPLFPAADGGKILIEASGELSPLVRSLIQQNDPKTRIVTYTPSNQKRFFAGLLSAAGFYSVEEDFSVAFGADPILTVSTDFKVENDSNSPLQNDIFLFNTGSRSGGFPPALTEYMASQGFRVIDSNSSGITESTPVDGAVSVITEKEPSVMADRLMSALNLGYVKEKEIDLLNMGDGGIGLRVKADRYFEKNGEKFVVSAFKGDPENYTILRLLEAQRYHVIMLTPEEDFRSVSGKILSQLRLPSRYEMQELLGSGDIPYTIRMSGIMVKTPGKQGKIFLTAARPERIITELLELNGYIIHDSPD